MDLMQLGLSELRQRLEEAKAQLNATPYDVDGSGSRYRTAMRKVNRLDARIDELEAKED